MAFKNTHILAEEQHIHKLSYHDGPSIRQENIHLSEMFLYKTGVYGKEVTVENMLC